MDAATTSVPKEQLKTGEPFTDTCVNTIRFLAIDAVEKASSGHPGMPMGMAPTAFALFDKHLRFNPKNPKFINRDRFVLSAGHGSMLIYALLYLYGYDSVSLDDIKQFRQLNSKTPGHPESNDTPGVEVTTGPLGQGICNAVGMAIAEAHAAATYNTDEFTVIDNYTYAIMGDGCVMEGMSSEASSLAGHLKLGKLIAIYDDNSISIGTSHLPGRLVCLRLLVVICCVLCARSRRGSLGEVTDVSHLVSSCTATSPFYCDGQTGRRTWPCRKTPVTGTGRTGGRSLTCPTATRTWRPLRLPLKRPRRALTSRR